jgi:hypothetical protein
MNHYVRYVREIKKNRSIKSKPSLFEDDMDVAYAIGLATVKSASD